MKGKVWFHATTSSGTAHRRSPVGGTAPPDPVSVCELMPIHAVFIAFMSPPPLPWTLESEAGLSSGSDLFEQESSHGQAENARDLRHRRVDGVGVACAA